MAQHGQLGGIEALVAAARLPIAGSGPSDNTDHHGLPNTSKGRRNERQDSQIDMDPGLRALSEAYKGLPKDAWEASQLLNVLFGQTQPQSNYTVPVAAAVPSNTQNQALLNGYEQQINGSDNQATPFQQTRSGRISRPPVQDMLQALIAAAGPQPSLQGHTAPSAPSAASAPAADLPTLFQAFAALQQAQSSAARAPLAEVGTSQSNGLPGGMQNGGQTVEGTAAQSEGPVKRKRGRRPLSEEDKLARRRARNKVSALESRQRKKEHIDDLEDQLNAKEDECTALSDRVRQLEQEVQMLRGVILGANLVLPGPGTPLAMPTPRQSQPAVQPQSTIQVDAAVPTTAQSSTHVSDIPPSTGKASTLAPRFPIPALPSHLSPMVSTTPASMADTPASIVTAAGTEGAFDPSDPAYNTVFDAVPIPSFDMFFNLDPSDMDGEEDGDFLPESSPKLSESEDSGDDDEPETTPRVPVDGIAAKSPRSASGKKRRKHRHKSKGKAKKQEDDDDWVDPDQEDEDLFLPIEDVPVPPVPELEDANGLMKEMGIQSQDQLGNVVRRIIEAAGEKEMNPDILGKLKAVLAWTQKDAA